MFHFALPGNVLIFDIAFMSSSHTTSPVNDPSTLLMAKGTLTIVPSPLRIQKITPLSCLTL